MQKLMNSLFVMAPESYLSLDGETVVAKIGEKVAGRFPLHSFASILYFGQRGVSPSLMGACADRGIGLSFFTPTGEFLAGIQGKSNGDVLLKKKQYEISSDEEASLCIAKNIITGKIYNTRWVVERTTRDYRQRVNVQKLKAASTRMKEAYHEAPKVTSFKKLRKLENEITACYYAVLDELILQRKDDFYFTERSVDPPKDKLNAVLSFISALTARDCAYALEGAGLDVCAGFLHRDASAQGSLALDLMEELSSIICDRFTVSLINIRALNATHFDLQENGAVFLNKKGKKTVLNFWQARKKEKLQHPFLQEKITWGMVPNIQALLLARYIRGEIDSYPPFLWK